MVEKKKISTFNWRSYIEQEDKALNMNMKSVNLEQEAEDSR